MMDELKTALKEGVVNVNFTKVNGEIREMKCTLDFNRIPLDKHPKEKSEENGDKSRSKNMGVVPVFDVEKSEWRSFKVDSVNSWVLL
jgi:hypothetical protein